MKYWLMRACNAGTELSWIGGVEAVHRCATKMDCYGTVLCGGHHLKVGCVDGKCVCVPTDDTSDAIIIDPPTLSPSAGGGNDDTDYASPTSSWRMPLNC